MTKQALAMEHTTETNLFNSTSSDYSQGKAILFSCCISYLNSRFLKMLQKFLEGCRVCQQCRLQCGTEIPELFLIKNPHCGQRNGLKAGLLATCHSLPFGDGNDG